MRRTVVTSEVQVVGTIWMPPVTASYTYRLSDYDVKNMMLDDGTITREMVENWLATHTGDFQSILDFRADISYDDKDVVIEWKDEESEMIYNDCAYGEED